MHRAARCGRGSSASPRLLLLDRSSWRRWCALPFVGRFFEPADPLQRADLIVVLAGARLDRWLEAVDLFKEGWAPKIVLSPGQVSALEGQLRGGGLKLPREGISRGTPCSPSAYPPMPCTVMPGGVDNTAAEAAALHRLLPAGSVHRVIVVTSTYHVRRAGYAFKREFEGSGVEIVARGSRYTEARPTRMVDTPRRHSLSS